MMIGQADSYSEVHSGISEMDMVFSEALYTQPDDEITLTHRPEDKEESCTISSLNKDEVYRSFHQKQEAAVFEDGMKLLQQDVPCDEMPPTHDESDALSTTVFLIDGSIFDSDGTSASSDGHKDAFEIRDNGRIKDPVKEMPLGETLGAEERCIDPAHLDDMEQDELQEVVSKRMGRDGIDVFPEGNGNDTTPEVSSSESFGAYTETMTYQQKGMHEGIGVNKQRDGSVETVLVDQTDSPRLESSLETVLVDQTDSPRLESDGHIGSPCVTVPSENYSGGEIGGGFSTKLNDKTGESTKSETNNQTLVPAHIESQDKNVTSDKKIVMPVVELNEVPSFTNDIFPSSETELNVQIESHGDYLEREAAPAEEETSLADRFAVSGSQAFLTSEPSDGLSVMHVGSESIQNEPVMYHGDDVQASQRTTNDHEQAEVAEQKVVLINVEHEQSTSFSEDNANLITEPSSANRSSAEICTSSHLPCPAGLGSSASPLEPAPRVPLQSRLNGTIQHQTRQPVEELVSGELEEYDETREKLQQIRVKFLRLAQRLGQTPHNVVVAQVLYRLGLAEQLRGRRTTSRAGAFSFDRASAMAVQLEAAGQEPLDFSCTIMVLGKTGAGKSSTVNSIFDAVTFNTDAFKPGTQKVQDVVGTVQGIKVRIIDTPGLLSSCTDQQTNEKILYSVKSFIKQAPPDIVLYLDRLDMQSRDYGDAPLLRTITNVFGPSIWFNAIVVLTHAASAPPDGPNGSPLSYEMFVTQRSHVVQQAIRQAAGDVRLMNPVSLVENHSACRTNRAGQRVLPNGQVWKPQLLLLSFASKILAEANSLLKLEDSFPGKLFNARPRVPSLPFLLSSLLQSRPPVKLPEQFGREDCLNEEIDEDSELEDEPEYDDLPPFKSLSKSQLAKLNKAQRRAYLDELEYREKLFMKKQLSENRKQRQLLKKMAAEVQSQPEDEDEGNSGTATVPVHMPDLALPVTFDSDNPTYRYRFLDSSTQWLMRPVLDSHGWDHDVGFDGLNVEKLFIIRDKVPVSFSGQVTKDKKECNLQVEVAGSVKHAEGKASSFGFEMQTIGKDVAYTLRSETKLNSFRRGKTTAGLSVTFLGDALSAGMKIEEALMVCRRLRVVMTGGAMVGRRDVAYGGCLEATLRDRDYPLGRSLSTLGLSIMDWHGDLAVGCNLQSQFPVGLTTNVTARANLNNRGGGQISFRIASSEHLQIALLAIFPVFQSLIRLYYSSRAA